MILSQVRSSQERSPVYPQGHTSLIIMIHTPPLDHFVSFFTLGMSDGALLDVQKWPHIAFEEKLYQTISQTNMPCKFRLEIPRKDSTII